MADQTICDRIHLSGFLSFIFHPPLSTRVLPADSSGFVHVRFVVPQLHACPLLTEWWNRAQLSTWTKQTGRWSPASCFLPRLQWLVIRILSACRHWTISCYEVSNCNGQMLKVSERVSNPEAMFEVQVPTCDKQHITATVRVPRPRTPVTVHIWGTSPETDPPAPPLTWWSSSARKTASGDGCVFGDWTFTPAKSTTFCHNANWFPLPVKAAHLSFMPPFHFSIYVFPVIAFLLSWFSAFFWFLCLAHLLCYITGHIVHHQSCFRPSCYKPSMFSC